MQRIPAQPAMRMPGAPQVAMPATSAFPGTAPASYGVQAGYGGQRMSAPTMVAGSQVVGGMTPQVVGGRPQVVTGGQQAMVGGSQVMMGGAPMVGMPTGMPGGVPMGGMPMGGAMMGMGGDMMCVMEVEVPMAMMMGPGGEMVMMDGMGPMGMSALGGPEIIMGGMGMGGPMGEIVIGPGGGAIVAAPQFRQAPQISLDDLPFSSIGHKAMWQGIFDMVQREVDAFLKLQKNNPQVSQFKAPRIPMPNIPDQQIEMIFDSYDMQKSGFLDKERIKALMRDMQCVTCVAMSNQKGEALQEARQELTMMLGPQLAAMMSSSVSQMMDFELQMVKQISMQDVPDDECNELIRDLDADKDGKVSKSDFMMNAKKTLFDPNPPEEIMQAMEAMEAAFNQLSVGGPMGGGPMMLMDGATGLPVQAVSGMPVGMGGATALGPQGAPGRGGVQTLGASPATGSAARARSVTSATAPKSQSATLGSRIASGDGRSPLPSEQGGRFVRADLGPPTISGTSPARPPIRAPTSQATSSQQYARPQSMMNNSIAYAQATSPSFSQASSSFPQRLSNTTAEPPPRAGAMKAKVIGGGISGGAPGSPIPSAMPPTRTTPLQRPTGGVSVGTAPGSFPSRAVYR